MRGYFFYFLRFWALWRALWYWATPQFQPRLKICVLWSILTLHAWKFAWKHTFRIEEWSLFFIWVIWAIWRALWKGWLQSMNPLVKKWAPLALTFQLKSGPHTKIAMHSVQKVWFANPFWVSANEAYLVFALFFVKKTSALSFPLIYLLESGARARAHFPTQERRSIRSRSQECERRSR